MEVDISKKVNNVLKFWLPGLVFLAILCAGGIWLFQQHNSTLTLHDARVTSTMVNAKTKAAGTITEILVEDGTHVEAGEVVARIKVDVTEEQLQQLEQTLELSQRNLATLKAGTTVTTPIYSSGGGNASSQAELERAGSNLQRMNRLYEIGAVSAAQRDSAAAEYAAAQASSQSSSNAVNYQSIVQPTNPEVIKNAEVQVRQAQAALEAAKQDAEATAITAPVAGTVYYTGVKADTKVKAGQTIINISDADSLWIEAHIKPEQKEKLHLGQFASYTIGQQKMQGTVFEIKDPAENKEAAANTEGPGEDSSLQDIIIKVSIPSASGLELKPGAKTSLEFKIK